MKKLLGICGSASESSSNLKLLAAMAEAFSGEYEFELYDDLRDLPLFTPQMQTEGIPETVKDFKNVVAGSDAVIISTPEYLHNIPAVLKNALEWMTESGELAEKSVLAITFTPVEPRGEYAMRSLIRSLKAIKANVVAELPLFRNQFLMENGAFIFDEEQRFLLREALSLL